MSENPYIVNYSDRSIAVLGPSHDIKDQLKNLGGKFNFNLNYDGKREKGWVFSKKKEKEVKKLIENTYNKSEQFVEEIDVEYQDVTFNVFKPFPGMNLFFYTYPDDDTTQDPVSIEATVTKTYKKKEDGTIRRMVIKYEGTKGETAIICNGYWTLQNCSFPNFIDVE